MSGIHGSFLVEQSFWTQPRRVELFALDDVLAELGIEEEEDVD